MNAMDGDDFEAREEAAMRAMRFPEVRVRVGLSRTSVWRLERRGVFPRRRRLGANSVCWLESEIEEWLHSRSPVA